jgi:DNA-binding MarR family transcriptional regulator
VASSPIPTAVRTANGQGDQSGDDHAAGDHAVEELASRLRLSINRLYRLLRQESLAGLSPAQASALGAVNRLGSPTLGELAAIEQVQPPTMTRIVATLTDAGMATRIIDDADRRSARVRITPNGRRALERIRTLKNAFLIRRLAELGPEEQAGAAELVALLEHLVGP